MTKNNNECYKLKSEEFMHLTLNLVFEKKDIASQAGLRGRTNKNKALDGALIALSGILDTINALILEDFTKQG